MEIIWSDAALQRATEVGTFIAKDSPIRATQFVEKLIKSVNRLSQFPYSGSVVPEHPAFRQVVFEGYRIFYRVSEKKVEIVTIISPGLHF